MKTERENRGRQNPKIKKSRTSSLVSLEKRILSYSVAAGAAVTGIENAQAIQFRDLGDIMVSNSSRDLDFNLDGQVDFEIFHSSSSATTPYFIRYVGASGRGLVGGNAFVGNRNIARNLNEGDNIGGNTGFAERANFGSIAYYTSDGIGSSNQTGNFLGVENAFFGVRFDDTDGNRLFGWGRVSMPDDGSKITFHDFAYNENPGESIRAGQTANEDPRPDGTPVPEPGTLGLFALGASGIYVWRRRKENCKQ